MFLFCILQYNSTNKFAINFLEEITPHVTLVEFATELSGRFYSNYVDNIPAKEALLQQSSPVAHLAAASLCFWTECSILSASPWFTWVRSCDNIADFLTRMEKLKFVKENFPSLFTTLHEFKCSEQIKKILMIDRMNFGCFDLDSVSNDIANDVRENIISAMDVD